MWSSDRSTNGTAGGGTVVIGPTFPAAYLTMNPAASARPSPVRSQARVRWRLANTSATLTLTGASNGGNIGTIGGDLTLCNCFGGGLDDRRRHAHRERFWPGRLRQRRHALGAEWRQAAGQRRSPGVERHGRLRVRARRSRWPASPESASSGREAHHQQWRRRSTARAVPRSMHSSSRASVTVTGAGSTWNVGGMRPRGRRRFYRRAGDAYRRRWRPGEQHGHRRRGRSRVRAHRS